MILFLSIIGLPMAAVAFFSLRWRTSVLIAAAFVMVLMIIGSDGNSSDKALTNYSLYNWGEGLKKSGAENLSADPRITHGFTNGTLPTVLGRLCAIVGCAGILGTVYWAPGAMVRRAMRRRASRTPIVPALLNASESSQLQASTRDAPSTPAP